MASHMQQRLPGGAMDLSHLVQRNVPASPAVGGGAAPGAAAPGGTGNPASQGGAGAPQVVDVPAIAIDVNDAMFEQVAQLSQVVPVVFSLWSSRANAGAELNSVLEKVAREQGGRIMLARVDVDASPGLAQAFQAQAVPTVVAMIGTRPVPLFQGDAPEEQVRDFFGQLIQLAEQNGVTGRVNAPGLGENDAESGDKEPAAPQIPEAHVPAVEAAERGDYETAVAEWERVLQKAPADAQARAALVQVKLLHRLQGHTVDEIRTAAGTNPTDIDAQMRVADLDLSGGHIEDAFLRLLDLFRDSDQDARARIRERLLELFEVVGVADPRVIAARGQLANMLY